MKTVIPRFATKSGLLITAFVVALSAGFVANAQQKVELTGHWAFNKSMSDDAARKIQAAKKQAEAASGGPLAIGSMGGNHVSSTGGGMGAGGDSWDGPAPPNFKDKVWIHLGENPKFLQIDQTSDKISVSSDSGYTQVFYPDGEKHEEKNQDGKKVTVNAKWQGENLIAETKVSHTKKLTQTFTVLSAGGRLLVTTRFDIDSLPDPVIIRRAYDLAK